MSISAPATSSQDRRPPRALLLATVVAAAFLVGCGGNTAVVVRKPRWDFDAYERIAVVPAAASDPAAQVHAEQMTMLLSDELAANGAFTVVSRRDLAAVMREQDLAFTDLADPETALPSGMIQVAEALIIPALLQYELDQYRELETVPVFRTDRRGRLLLRKGLPVQIGEREVPVYTHLARVAGSVRVVDAATGAILFAHNTVPIEVAESERESPPVETPEFLAGVAIRELARELYVHVAPIEIEVRFDGDSLLLATGYYDGRYDELDKIPANRDTFLLVVRDLPEEVDRNDFTVTITEKDGRTDLFRETFVWSAAAGRRGIVFEVPTGLLKSTGAEEFTAKLYAPGNDEPVLDHDFALVAPKRDRDDRDEDEEQDD